MKAGIVEIPHLIVVTKADLGAAAERARADVAGALSLATAGDWPLKALAVSSRSRAGIEALMAALEGHRAYWPSGGSCRAPSPKRRLGARSPARALRHAGTCAPHDTWLGCCAARRAQPFERLRALTTALETPR